MRRVRAVVIIAILWGALWFLVGIPIRALTEAMLHADFEPPPPFFELPTVLMVWGAIAGAAFAGFLIAAERAQTLHTLSRSRVAMWGALGSLAFPIGIIVMTPGEADWVPMAIIGALSAILGAVCAGGTLALARHAPTDSANSGARAA
jgi:hypothetical protein